MTAEPLPPMFAACPWCGSMNALADTRCHGCGENPQDTPPAEVATPSSAMSGLLDWATFWADDYPDEEWVIQPLIPAGRGVSLYAPAKAGKSTILLAACAAAATGRSVFGQPPQAARRGMYADYEMTKADLHERLVEMGYGPGDDLSNLAYYLIPPWAPLDTPEGGAMITAAALAHSAEFVTIDTYGRAVQGEENAADTTRAFFRCTGQALKREDIAWLRLDHSGKDITKGGRGSSAKVDDVDIVWRLTRNDSGVTVTRTHSRIPWVPEKIVLHKHEDDDGVVTYEMTGARGYSSGTKELAAELDRLGLPATTSRPKARAALKTAGIPATNTVLADAVRWRKRAAEHGSDSVTDSFLASVSDRSTDSPAETSLTSPDSPTDKLGQVNGVTSDRGVSVGTDTPVREHDSDTLGAEIEAAVR